MYAPYKANLQRKSFHELGHARAIMTGDYATTGPDAYRTDDASLRLENKVRELKHPEAGPQQRVLHDPPHTPGAK